MEQEQGILLNSAIKEVIKAIRWIHEHAEPRAARFLTEVQGIYADNSAFQQAYNELQLDPDTPKSPADLASAMSGADEDALSRLDLIVKDFVEIQKGFKPLDPLKAYQRGEGPGMEILKSGVSLEVNMKGDEDGDGVPD